MERNVEGYFKQVLIKTPSVDITYLYSHNGNVKRLEKAACNQAEQQGNDRAKNYLLSGDIPALVDLGVVTRDGKVVSSMYSKFRQINKFVEVIDETLGELRDGFTVVEFGCGKSYLTFVLYHYLVNVRKARVNIVGYDLKKDVVDNCNRLAAKYGYENLRFVCADVTKDKLFDGKIDAVISLHACDVATDYALHFAAENNADYIFSVPCCQHEVNSTIRRGGGELDMFLEFGIVKERFSALLPTLCARLSCATAVTPSICRNLSIWTIR